MEKYSLMPSPIPHHRRQSRKTFHFLPTLIAFCLSVNFISCSFFRQVRYDENTYRHLTFLKAEVWMLYDSFTEESIDKKGINDIILKITQILEYEKGKGLDKNSEMVQQIEDIQKMFRNHVKERENQGPWNPAHLNNKKENIGDAFDLAIKTERAKNR